MSHTQVTTSPRPTHAAAHAPELTQEQVKEVLDQLVKHTGASAPGDSQQYVRGIFLDVWNSGKLSIHMRKLNDPDEAYIGGGALRLTPGNAERRVDAAFKAALKNESKQDKTIITPIAEAARDAMLAQIGQYKPVAAIVA